MPMKEALKSAIRRLRKRGAQYADVRCERTKSESIQVRNSVIESFSRDSSSGIGVRVLYNGAWGFAGGRVVTGEDALRMADEALSIAKAFSSVNRVKSRLSPTEPVRDSFRTDFRIDPFTVPPEDKIRLLLGVTEEASRRRKVAVAEAFVDFTLSKKDFLSTEGSEITQEILTSGGGFHVIAEDGDEAQRRSYPDSHHGLFATRGYEHIEEMGLGENLDKVVDEARSLLKAKECPSGVEDVIIDGPQMALQIHESCGHPAELDRVLGSEISFAGGSFLTLDKRGSFRYGSKIVNIYADPNIPGGAGSYKYDDEGVKARRVDIVRGGVFAGHLSSRESARTIGEESNGSTRAATFGSIPIVRMSNICLEPGEGTLPDLVSDTRDGLLLSTNRSWSIDDKRLNFQFGCEIAYRIRRGRVTGIYKNPLYYGVTPAFWASCDSITGEGEWRMWGLNSCAKGEPTQVINVGHGASPARFRKVRVGVLKDE